MASGTVASRVLGVLRQSLIVYAVGQGIVGNLFQTANNLPNVIYMLIAGGVLNSVLVPQIVKAMRLPDAGQEYTDRIITLSCVGMLIVTFVCTAVSGLLIRLYAADLPDDQLALATFFATLTLPQIFFYGLYAVLGQVLNARNQFAAFGWAPAFANVLSIVGLVAFLGLYNGHVGPMEWTAGMVWVFAGTATLSVVAQALVLVIALARSGFHWTPRFGVRGVGLRTTSRVAGWAFLALVLSQLGYLVASNVMYHASNSAAPGEFIPGVLLYSTAFFVFMVPHAFVALSIITALYPRMSAAVHDGDAERLRGEYVRGLVLPTVLTIPASFALAVFALPIATLLFTSRNPQEVPATALVIAVMAPAVVPFGIDVLNQRFFYAHDDGRMVFFEQVVLTVSGTAVTVFALALRPQITVAIVGLGIVVSNVLSSAFGMWFVRRRLGRIGLKAVANSWLRMVAAGAISAGLGYLASAAVASALPGRLGALVQLLVGGAVFAVIYVVLTVLLGVREVHDILGPLFRRLPSRRPPGRHAARS
jgi:putative peptidoglycan lipid II flippase